MSEQPVALITGASRGIGKAIAIEFARAGYHVYATGRTQAGEQSPSTLPGTLDDTISQIESIGGTAVAVRCDHASDTEVEALFSQIDAEASRLDVLVNNVWAGYAPMQRKLEEALSGRKSRKKMIEGMEHAFGEFTDPFWTLPTDNWDLMNTVGARSHYVATVLAARQMVARKNGVVINLTADISQVGGQVGYSMAKAAVNRMTIDTAAQLKAQCVTVVGLQPGMVLTEMFEERFRKGFLDEDDFERFEAPAFVGTCAVALAADNDVQRFSGETMTTSEVSETLGVERLDGSHVDLSA